jgi:hypothetical protein
MTSGHPLHRVLANVCSADTMSRVVDPIFADMRWEDGRMTWRGCVALVKALTLHAATSLPGWCAAVWADDEHAIPQAAGFVLVGAALAAALLLISPTIQIAVDSPLERTESGVKPSVRSPPSRRRTPCSDGIAS